MQILYIDIAHENNPQKEKKERKKQCRDDSILHSNNGSHYISGNVILWYNSIVFTCRQNCDKIFYLLERNYNYQIKSFKKNTKLD